MKTRLETGDPSVLYVEGDVDGMHAHLLKAAGKQLVTEAGASEWVTLDFTNVSFIDSTGLGALAAIHVQAADHGQTIRLRERRTA